MSIGFGHGVRLGALKLHHDRCVVAPEKIHFSKSTKRKSKKFYLKVNRNYQAVIDGVVDQHGRDWLMQPLANSFAYINAHPDEFQIRCYSIELYDKQTDELVAGELGYVCGSIYTSQTGFRTVSSSGSVQLYLMSELLKERGCTLIDFGMMMEYKEDMGCETIPRAEWRQTIKEQRERADEFILDLN